MWSVEPTLCACERIVAQVYPESAQRRGQRRARGARVRRARAAKRRARCARAERAALDRRVADSS
eukprot:2419933-Lingulodinium_polyedra.AAC.1